MSVRTILVCETQVPLVQGGAELLVRQLVAQLCARGYQVDRVSLPFKWYPKEEILAHAAAWRLLDLSESNGRPIDCVIATKFPSYFVRHPNKVTWLVHQHRAAYDLCGTRFSDFDETEADVGLRDRLLKLDREMLAESRRLFTIGRVVSERLEKYNGLRAPALHNPPALAPRLKPGPYGDYVLSVGRLESIKRVDLAVRAMQHTDPSLKLIVAGDGTHRPEVERETETLGLSHRVQFLGTVDDDTLVGLYANALGVVYAPYDEDYGYVTLEAFLSVKPVVTARDSGGTLDFVVDNVNGFVCEPQPEALGAAIQALASDRRRAQALGEAGLQCARGITWDTVIEQLVAEKDE
jgi:glycosyltransferase involved in cell wall biosynthesis